MNSLVAPPRVAAMDRVKRPWQWRCRLSALAWLGATALNAWAGEPVAISTTQALSFGRFAAGQGGTVTIHPGGSRSATGGTVLVSSGGGSPARFNLTGNPSSTYAITLPSNGTVTLVNGAGQTMAVNGFSSSPHATGQLSPAGGSQTLFIGATLSVGALQPPGNYSGTFHVSVDYN